MPLIAYITTIGLLESLAMGKSEPPQAEILSVLQMLTNNPVEGYPAFTFREVRLMGVYRELLNPRIVTGRIDDVWEDIRRGEWYGWLYAVHEAKELQAFVDIGVNPFDMVSWRHYWKACHLCATAFELQYLRDWAVQLGFDVPEIAIEQTHPIRGRYAVHAQHLRDLREAEGWQEASEDDLPTAAGFWQQIRQR